MPQIECIHHFTEIEQGNGWVDSPKFESRARLVDANGQATSPELEIKNFRIISKKEYHFSCVERVGRSLLGMVAVLCSLGIALLFKRVRDLVTKDKSTIRYAIEQTPLFANTALSDARKINFFLEDGKVLPFIIHRKDDGKYIGSSYEHLASKALVKIAQNSSHAFLKVLTHPCNFLVNKEQFLQFLIEKDGSRLWTLSAESTLDQLMVMQEADLKIDFRKKNSQGDTLFLHWVRRGNVPIVHRMLEIDPLLIKKSASVSESPLVTALLRRDGDAMRQLLLETWKKNTIELLPEEEWMLKTMATKSMVTKDNSDEDPFIFIERYIPKLEEEKRYSELSDFIRKEERLADLEGLIRKNNLNMLCKKVQTIFSSEQRQVWLQVLSRFEPESREHVLAVEWYSACILHAQMCREGVMNPPLFHVNFEKVLQLCKVAQQAIAEKKERPFIIKKGSQGQENSLLIDFMRKSFTVLGAGPIKREGGQGKIRSAIEVLLKKGDADFLPRAEAVPVVRKTNLPGFPISDRELDNERLFGSLRSVVHYTGKKIVEVQKTSFTMDAFEMNLAEFLIKISKGERPSLTIIEKLELLDSLSSQLELIHDLYDRVHYDIKLENVLFRVNKNGKKEWKLCDYGFCRRRGDAFFELGSSPKSYGTYMYTSPDILGQDPVISYKPQDIYALGCIALMVYTGKYLAWALHVDKALREGNLAARTQGLELQRKINFNNIDDADTVDSQFARLMFWMLDPSQSTRPRIKDARTKIDEIKQKYV